MRFMRKKRNKSSQDKAAGATATAARTQKIGTVALELVITDLRDAWNHQHNNRRCRPFVQITTANGHVVARSTVLQDAVMDATFPILYIAWKDMLLHSVPEGNNNSNKNNNHHVDVTAVLQQPLLITVYDFCPFGKHEIIGQVPRTSLLELAEKAAAVQQQQQSSTPSLAQLCQSCPPSFPLIWQDMAVMADVYVKQVQLYQSSPPAAHHHHHHAWPRILSQTHMDRGIPAPLGIPAVPQQHENETQAHAVPPIKTYHETNTFHDDDDDDDDETNITESMTECSSLAQSLSPCSSRSSKRVSASLQPSPDSSFDLTQSSVPEEQEVSFVQGESPSPPAVPYSGTKTQALIQAAAAATAKLKQKRMQQQQQQQQADTTIAPPSKTEAADTSLYIKGRSQALMALAEERRLKMQQKRSQRAVVDPTPP